jgi:hypothetical protein
MPQDRRGSTGDAVTDDEWQAHVTHEAAKAIGEWLEGRGNLQQPLRSLAMRDLEAMAQNAISQFIVLTSRRIVQRPSDPGSQKLSLLLGV